jgi:hypothetical protein
MLRVPSQTVTCNFTPLVAAQSDHFQAGAIIFSREFYRIETTRAIDRNKIGLTPLLAAGILKKQTPAPFLEQSQRLEFMQCSSIAR